MKIVGEAGPELEPIGGLRAEIAAKMEEQRRLSINFPPKPIPTQTDTLGEILAILRRWDRDGVPVSSASILRRWDNDGFPTTRT